MYELLFKLGWDSYELFGLWVLPLLAGIVVFSPQVKKHLNWSNTRILILRCVVIIITLLPLIFSLIFFADSLNKLKSGDYKIYSGKLSDITRKSYRVNLIFEDKVITYRQSVTTCFRSTLTARSEKNYQMYTENFKVGDVLEISYYDLDERWRGLGVYHCILKIKRKL